MNKSLLFAIVGVLALAGAGALFMLGMMPGGGGEGDQAETADAHAEEVLVEQYLTLDPPFVVNFVHRGTLRYLQLSLDLMYHKPETISAIEQKMPAIRNDLIMLFSEQEFEQLHSQEGKQQLREEIELAIANIVGLEEDEDDGEVYITNFVMQ